MENKITIDLAVYKILLENESKKLVGKLMKRFELSNDVNTIKKECKELVYESFRDIIDTLNSGKILFENKELQK